MEPNYVAANKRIDAMAVAWLFARDYVFFNPGEITWDGKHHGIVGAQINAAKIDEIPEFMRNSQMYYQGMGDLLMTLERDEELIVPRSKIHPGLYSAIREGDLTGITLFNLQACAQAFQFLGGENDSDIRRMLQMAGLGNLADNPVAMFCTKVLHVDQRLTRGIPGFYGLVRRMFEDMQAYNKIDLPYVLLFTTARNFDADQCLDYFEDSVEGAVSESFHVETNIDEWKAAHEENNGSVEGGVDEEGIHERSASNDAIRIPKSAGSADGGNQPSNSAPAVNKGDAETGFDKNPTLVPAATTSSREELASLDDLEEEFRKKFEEAERKAEERLKLEKAIEELSEKKARLEERKETILQPAPTPSELEASEVEDVIRQLELELNGLNPFAKSKKKELEKSLSEKRELLRALNTKIARERKAAESEREAEAAKVKREIAAIRNKMDFYERELAKIDS